MRGCVGAWVRGCVGANSKVQVGNLRAMLEAKVQVLDMMRDKLAERAVEVDRLKQDLSARFAQCDELAERVTEADGLKIELGLVKAELGMRVAEADDLKRARAATTVELGRLHESNALARFVCARVRAWICACFHVSMRACMLVCMRLSVHGVRPLVCPQ